VSLIELSIAMSILSLVLGAVLALQLQAVRMYQETASADWANFDAAMAIARLEKDIQQCFRVTGRYSDRITITRPLMAYDAVTGTYLPVQPLAEGDSVRYYLSDASGVLYVDGTCLWRAVRPAGGSSFVKDSAPLADNITTLQFEYVMMPAPRSASVKYVDLLIRAQVKEGGATRTRSHSSRLTLRNAPYGPVTSETGTDEEE
jgi:type II secretory pathway component PulJ